VPQSLGTVTIQFREFGVRLECCPIVLGGGRLKMQVAPEVSERDFTSAVSLTGTTVPGLTTRRVNSEVEMRFGQTLVIAGLISNRVVAEVRKTPFLGELPWVGALFSRKRFDESETELLVLVTPEPVSPLDECQVGEDGPGRQTVSPTDREFFGQGLLEVPRYGPDCPDCDSGLDAGYPPQLAPGEAGYGDYQGPVGGDAHTPPAPADAVQPAPPSSDGKAVPPDAIPNGAVSSRTRTPYSSKEPLPRAKGLIVPAEARAPTSTEGQRGRRPGLIVPAGG
jgi:pilus assembly protein CpaC